MYVCINRDIYITLYISPWSYIKAGVPQGTNFGALSFLIFINDIENIYSIMKLFADDTPLLSLYRYPTISAVYAYQLTNSRLLYLHTYLDSFRLTQ